MKSLPSEEIVTNEAVILDCLTQISKNNSPLSLTLREAELNDVYHSRIQSLDIGKGQIVLNQILPSDWRDKINSVNEFEIKSYMNMGNIRFYGLLSPLDNSENNPYSRLTFPKKIFRMQQRDYYRVSLAKIRSSVTLKYSDNSALQGSCRDISMSGAMVTLPKISSQVAVGQLIDECKISIDDILELEFRGKVRSLHKTDSDTLAGIQFLDLSTSQLKPISTALNKIDRKNITN